MEFELLRIRQLLNLKELAIHNDIILGFFSFNHNSKADNIIEFMKGFSRFLF